MKKIVFNFLLLSSSFALAQTSVLNATSPEKFRQEREAKKDSLAAPLKYGFIEDKDVLKSMVVLLMQLLVVKLQKFTLTRILQQD